MQEGGKKHMDVNKIRESFPKGTRVKLIKMLDFQAPPKGTKGTVHHVDDMGQIHVEWDNGSTLALILGEDLFEVI